MNILKYNLNLILQQNTGNISTGYQFFHFKANTFSYPIAAKNHPAHSYSKINLSTGHLKKAQKFFRTT